MRITFAAVPAYGHVLPLLPLAAAAVEAGHEVALGAGEAFAGQLAARHFSVVPPGMTLHDAEEEARPEVTDYTDPMAWPTAMFGVVMPRHVVPRLHEDWARHGSPDLVVHEASNIGAAIAAREAGIPSVAFHIALAAPALFVTALRRVADFPFEVLIDPRPERWRGTEPALCQRIPIRSVAWSDTRAIRPELLNERPTGTTAYLTMGTVAFGAVEILRRSILELAKRCSRVLVAAGPDSDTTALGELPNHVSVERFVDQPAALNWADVAVHHGGTGTVLGCLATGVPQVITPQGADQFLNAARLREVELGYAVPNDAPAGSVGQAVDRLLSDAALGERVGAVQAEIAAMPAPADVVGRLADLVRPR